MNDKNIQVANDVIFARIGPVCEERPVCSNKH